MPNVDLALLHSTDEANAHLRELTRLWLKTRKSEHTRRAYHLDLASWLGWCRANDVRALEAWPGHILEWLAVLTAGDPVTGRQPEKGTTRARRLRAVSGWYKWLMLTTGIRVGELIAANAADIGQDRGVTVLHVRGKGGKTRPVEIEPYTMGRLDAYLAGRGDVDLRPVRMPSAGAGAERPLIATSSGKRIDRKGV